MAILKLAYWPILPPDTTDRRWSENEWPELVTMDRFWPGFLRTMADPDSGHYRDVLEDWITVDLSENAGMPAREAHARAVAMLDDQDLLGPYLRSNLVDINWEAELFQGASDPFEVALRAADGVFDLDSTVIDNEIYFMISEVVTGMSPDAPDRDWMPSRDEALAVNRRMVMGLSRDLGMGLRSLINRRDV